MSDIDKAVTKTLPPKIEFTKLEKGYVTGLLALWDAKTRAEQTFNESYATLAEEIIERRSLPLKVDEFMRHYNRLEKDHVAHPEPPAQAPSQPTKEP